MLETTALGAAYLAGLATGFWGDIAEAAQHWQEEARFAPTITAETRQSLRTGWNKALGRAKKWAC